MSGEPASRGELVREQPVHGRVRKHFVLLMEEPLTGDRDAGDVTQIEQTHERRPVSHNEIHCLKLVKTWNVHNRLSPTQPGLRPVSVLPRRATGDAQKTQTPPNVPHERTRHADESITLQVRLVAVHGEDTLSAFRVLQDQPLASGHPVLHHALAPSTLYVVIADDEMESGAIIESVEQIEDAPVRNSDSAEAPMLPQLVTISNLHVRVALAIVTGQHAQEERLILGENVSFAIVAAVRVAEEDQG
jgi:hypothetical protein